MKRFNRVAIVVAMVGVVAQFAFGTALTAERRTPARTGDRITIGVYTNTRIFAGAMVALNSSGYAVAASDSASINVIGKAVKTVDNRTNASGAGDSGTFTIDVDRGVFLWVNGDSYTDANIGDLCFVEDDQTVQKAASASQDIIAGVILDVDSDGVWVDTYDIGAQGASAPSSLAVSGAATVGTTLDVGGRLTVTDSDGVADVGSIGYEAYDATVTLSADQSDDAADDWFLASVASDNCFLISNSVGRIVKITAAGIVSLLNGASLDNVTSATKLTITETEVAISGKFTAPVLTTATMASNSYVCASTDYGKIMVLTWTNTIAVTLPANGAAAGSYIDFMIKGDDSIAPTISAATVDTLVGPNDNDLDSVTYGTGHRIGSYLRCISDGAFWHALNMGTTTMTGTD